MTKEQLFLQLTEKLASGLVFYGHGAIDAEDEAMMIMMYLFCQSVDEILSTGEESVPNQSKNLAFTIVDKRVSQRIPLAYILGKVWYCGLEFVIDKRALVPRSPFAELIISGFRPWVNMDEIDSVLDLCTGSGCIGISIAKHNEHLNVGLADISEAALQLANINIEKHKLSNRVHSIESDLFENINQQYDLIVSNPPYVGEDEYKELPKEYFSEPELGLVSNMAGLEIPVRILLQAVEYLKDDGLIFLEVGYSDELLEDCFPEIDIQWVQFFNGGQGVCVFDRKKLLECRPYFKRFLEQDNVI